MRALSRETQHIWHISSQSIPAIHTYQSQQVVCVLFACSLARLFVCLFAVGALWAKLLSPQPQVLPAPVRMELSCTHSMLEDVGLGEFQTLTP